MKKFSFQLIAFVLLMTALAANHSFAQGIIPGKIEAESYTAMSGVQTENTADIGGGLNVGWIDANDWMDYSVNVQTTGTYTVSFRIASTIASPKLQLKTPVSTYEVTLPNTNGYQNWATVTSSIALNAGVQTLRITALTNGFNFNWMQLDAVSSSNLSKGKTATASSSEGSFIPGNAVDGNTGTRWASNYNNDEWMAIDLGQNYSLNKVTLNWEVASAKSFDIEVSSNNTSWTSVYHTDAGEGGIQNINISAQGRYVRMHGKSRNTPYGYSLWEFEIYGTTSSPTNQNPVANAGTDKTITLPTNSITLAASGSDPDGDPITYSWSKISGPAATLSGANTSTLSVSELVEGSYLFRLTVADNKGGLASDDVKVTVISPTTDCNQILSSGKTAYASSVTGSNSAALAFDGDMNTRWESLFSDPQWITLDLGSVQTICKIVLEWETASGKSYQIQASNDNTSWTNLFSTATGDGGHDEISVSGSGRYVRMYGTTRNTGYGYSLFEFSVLGGNNTTEDTQPPTAPASVTATPAVYAVTLNWTASTDNIGVQSYKIYQGTNVLATVQGTSTAMTISGLNPDTEYTYTVKAIDAAGNESSGTSVTFRTEKSNTNTGDGVIAIGNIALSMPATSSSSTTGNSADRAVDGNVTSRWESNPTDNEWMMIDLGIKYQIGRVILNWETASGKNYLIQVSDDAVTWTTAYEFNQTNLPQEPRKDDFTFSATGRYIRMMGKVRNTQWGYSLFEFEVYSPGSGPEDIPDPNPNPNPAPVPPGPSTFNVIAPVNGSMITDSRRPTLSWNTSAGAVKYEIWVNITRTDYDWYAWGSLLDRFTKMGETTSTSYTLLQDLSDRWTYKWYIVAINGSGEKTYSTLGQFSVYLPVLEQQADGVNLLNGCRDLNKNGSVEPYENWKLPIETRLNDLMSRMTLEEKAYQMFYNAQAFPLSGWAFGPGTVSDMFNKQKACAATRLGIPFVSAGDCIHGYSTTYPTQSTLAASRNLELVRQCGNIQREEQKAVGLRGTLAPLAEVGTKVLYPRIQEGCGEDADFAAAMIKALVCGLQGGPELNPNSVMVTTKHWPGEGAGGEAGIVYDGVTIKYHMKPWFANVEAGAGSVMPGYAGSSFLDPGGAGAGDSKPILDYLRNVVHFDGVICTDWLPWGSWVNAAKAGSDVMGGADPGAVGFVMADFISQVGEDRINEAVKRILTAKFKLGVFEDPYGDPVNGPDTWFTPDKVNIVTDAARQSMTLLKNDGILPLNLPAGSNLLVTGSRANDGNSYSVWTSYFHDEYGAKTMYQSLKEKGSAKGINVYLDNAPTPQAAVVIIGEPSYTHGTAWDKNMPYIHDAYYPVSNTYEYDKTTLENVKAMGIPYVVVVIMPRPYVLTDVLTANSVLIAYRPGDGGGPALAQILFGEYAPKGKLPWQLPRSMDQIGTDDMSNAKERWDLPFDLGATPAQIQEIRSKIAAGESLQPIYGDPLFQYGYGIQGYGSAAEGLRISDEESGFKEIGSETARKPQVMVYPNPSDHSITIETDLKDKREITIQDAVTGRIILTQKDKNMEEKSQMDVSSLKSGLYILKIKTSQGVKTLPLIKN